jgi:protease-4
MEKTKQVVSFGRVFWPSLIASVVVLTLLILFFFVLFGSIFSGPEPFSIKDKTVLHMTLKGQIGESSKSEFNPSSFSMDQQVGLADILYGFEKAAEDKRVKGIFIELDGAQCGYATAGEIRNAILKFQEESGKFVLAYHKGEAVGMKQYFIASAAKESYGFPSTMFEFGGLGAELMFFKGMFDKLDLEMQVVRGSNNDFKSAVEPFFLERMSDSSKHQIERYLTSMWEDIRGSIGASKGISPADLNLYADSTYIRRMKDAAEYKLIDDVKYRDEVMDILAQHAGAKDAEHLELMSFEKFAAKKFENNQKVVGGSSKSSANIAVILAEGGVTTSGDGLASDKITKLLRQARLDENIKTIVFRVNSPGGSALASDEIWREVVLAEAVKPVIVSMGDVAASGGYYIAAPATRIFAEPMTITGSIGVFGVIPYTGGMLENKLGLSFDRVSTNSRAVLTTNKRMTPAEFQIIQDEVDFIYDEFLQRVADGRGMTKEQVNAIARGRVWTGKDALAIGLVDELGGINDAIAYAAKEAGIDKPKIQYLPKIKKEPLLELIEALDQKDDEASSKKGVPEELMEYYNRLRALESYVGIQARLPYELKLN